MERIKTSKQLRFERSKLLQRKAELEKAIKQDWGYLKDDLKPGRAACELYNEFSKSRNEKDTGFCSRLFSLWADRYKKQWATNAAEKIKSWFKD